MPDTAGPADPVEAPATLTVDLGALASNWRLLAARAGPAECAAAVKADAYGIGIEPAVRTLASAGCRTFFVAHLGEGRRVRAVAPEATIYVLNGLLPNSEAVYDRHGLRPVLGSAEDIGRWAAHASGSGAPCPAAVHVDTGLNRLGLPTEQAQDLLTSRVNWPFQVSLLMSHFVAAEDPGAAVTVRQIAVFDTLRRLAPDIPASLANSSGLFLPEPPVYELVRPGYALYGGNPTPDLPNPMRTVVRLSARILQCRTAPPGATVGYGARWTARGERRLATIGVGYADGVPRAASGLDGYEGGQAIVRGVRCPFAGRVSMDLIVLDVTDVPGPAVAPGEWVDLLNDELTVDEAGARAGTMGYEILTGLSRRFHRVYREA